MTYLDVTNDEDPARTSDELLAEYGATAASAVARQIARAEDLKDRQGAAFWKRVLTHIAVRRLSPR